MALERAISSTAVSLVDLTPCIFMTNSSTFVAQRRASSVEIISSSQSRKSDWSNVCMLYCDVPWAIAFRMRCVLLASMMQSRINAVLTMTSTAGTRPVPSALGTNRFDRMAVTTLAS